MYIYSIFVIGVIKEKRVNQYRIFSKTIRDAQPHVVENLPFKNIWAY